MKSLSTWNLIKLSLDREVPVMLLYVLESNGSSPGRQGFFMAVQYDGPSASPRIEGSIGGGIMEHKFVEMAKSKLQLHEMEPSVYKQVHDKSSAKNQSGMICSGEQTIFMYKICEADREPIYNIIHCLEKQQNGTLKLSPAGISYTDKLPSQPYYLKTDDEENWTYTERIGFKNHLYIVGGGHCALAFANIMGMMDFYIQLYDDRKDLNTMIKNNYAHEKQVVKDYSILSQLIPEGENNYVVIMTFGYRTDYIALSSLLKKKFKYVGLLGSKNKIQKMFANYRQEGVDEKILQHIHAPVGLSINSQTPEEIAISIAAEIIKVKNEKP